jgi:ABC-type glycerol-3-phosphate transport system permease component
LFFFIIIIILIVFVCFFFYNFIFIFLDHSKSNDASNNNANLFSIKFSDDNVKQRHKNRKGQIKTYTFFKKQTNKQHTCSESHTCALSIIIVWFRGMYIFIFGENVHSMSLTIKRTHRNSKQPFVCYCHKRRANISMIPKG